ncbi:MAG: ATP-dependent DNA ligase [Alistipes sp.]|nr:ATP-dependent DNA ligase [Alistipes sp.]
MKTNFSELAKSYKRKISNTFFLVNGEQVAEIKSDKYCVTRKIDGTMQMLFYRDGEAVAVSTSGIERRGLPCLAEFASLVERAGFKSATVVAELYAVLNDSGRERVCNVATAIADKSLNERLKLAIFDLIDLDDEQVTAEYSEKLKKAAELFTGERVHTVQSRDVTSPEEVSKLYEEWVNESGAEGLVVHTNSPIVYKVKPVHNVDAVIIGYTLREAPNNNSIRDIMIAVMRPDGLFQQFAVTGSGFSQTTRRQMYDLLAPLTTNSDYVETDSRNIAFQMVRPEVVIELSVGDFVAEDSSGNAKMNTLLSYSEQQGYKAEASTPGVACHHARFVCIRDDKDVDATSIRISQITDICPFSERGAVSYGPLPTSEVIYRRVFTKGVGEKAMVQKYIIWRTNKVDSGLFPNYVFHYTDFSISRKEQLKRDIRVSSSEEQIISFAEEFIAANVKKGWSEVA